MFLAMSSPALAAPIRLVATSPQVTQILGQLGKGGDVVAGSRYGDDGAPLPTLGPLFMPSIEKLVVFNPNWVVVDAAFPMPIFESGVRAMGFSQYRFSIRSVKDLFDSSAGFLKAAYSQNWNQTLDHFRRCWEEAPAIQPSFKYLALAWAKPPILFSHETYLSDILKAIGGTNIADRGTQFNFPQVSEEWLIRQLPDRIYYLHETDYSGREVDELVDKIWPGRSIERIAMDPQIFSRAGFLPLSKLSQLRPSKNFKEFCRATP